MSRAGVDYASEFSPHLGLVSPQEKPWREEICLNGLWRFQPMPVPRDFKEGVSPAPELPEPEADAWDAMPIRIPSPWNVNSFADKDGLGGDFRCFPSYPKEWDKAKMGWLQRTFNVPADWKGRRIILRLSAIAGDAQIVVNGKDVGRHYDTFFSGEIDITDAVNFGGENTLNVGIRKASLFNENGKYGRRLTQEGSFWGQHIAGIWDDVYVLALPQVCITDTYVKPLVDAGALEVDLTLRNDTDKDVEVSAGGEVRPWIPNKQNDNGDQALPSSDLGPVVLTLPSAPAKIAAHSEATVVLHAKVSDELKLWSPEQPNLYGLVAQLKLDSRVEDAKYTRFGWRQFTLAGNQYLLNGKPITMKGDSWHFTGIPQMSRRYAVAWFKAMRDANLNAVRLHAQPYPQFYLDVADEMGILVLDETAIWASDGGPKLDDERFWENSDQHVAKLVKRDRNHPSIFGWSVSNEVLPVVVNVFSNPPGMKDKLVERYGIWAEICRKNDPTRPWISADGEGDGEGKLPTYIIHYGDESTMKRAVASGKPWGVGEAGNAYYGTPEQVSEANGDRAYESFLGRMEGVAASSYNSLVQQHKQNANFRSVFNLVWYGLEPLSLGMNDTSRPPALEDGIRFTSFVEGKPGVQPERLGPYCTTLNPGYDSSLPLYKPWPLFEAIRDGSAEPPVPCRWVSTNSEPPAATAATEVGSVKVLRSAQSKLAAELKMAGVPVEKLDTQEVPAVLFVDGACPPDAATRGLIERVLTAKGTVFVWGADAKSLDALNALLPSKIELTDRKASSLLLEAPDQVTGGIGSADLYFSEISPPEVITNGLGGPLLAESEVLLKACDTDWLKWNKQPEYAKTAMIIRSEREAKPSGAALIKIKVGEGRLYVTTIPASSLLPKREKLVRALLSNLGIKLAEPKGAMPVERNGEIVQALVCGSFPSESVESGAQKEFVDVSGGETMRSGASIEGQPWKPLSAKKGVFELKQLTSGGSGNFSSAYLSFWVSSPRDLGDLLSEPNIPVVGLDLCSDGALQVWVNGQEVLKNIHSGPMNAGKSKVESIRLHRGWNHFLIKVTQDNRKRQFSGRLTCKKPEFLADLVSAIEKP